MAESRRKIGTLGVVGAGAMGRGIAQVGATGGMSVLMYDAAPGAAAGGNARARGPAGNAPPAR